MFKPTASLHSFDEAVQYFWQQVWRCEDEEPCTLHCWPWRASMTGQVYRYGYFRVIAWGETFIPHRFAYQAEHYAYLLPFRHQVHICHRCDFPPCCNPAHLFTGTPKDNLHDACSKGYFRALRSGRVTLPDGRILHR